MPKPVSPPAAGRRLSRLMTPPGDESADDRALAWGARAVLLALLAALFWFTWASWPDLQIDCGRELYVPAELLKGKTLYADLWYPYGPLAPYLTALWFRLFGIHLHVLYFVGFAVTAGSVLLLHAIARRVMPPLPALLVGLCYGVQLFHPWLFNNILPYSFAATYGTLACLATVCFLLRAVGGEKAPNMALAGLCLALTTLARYEHLLPCVVGVALAALYRAWSARSWRVLALDGLAVLPGLALTGGVYGFLLRHFGLDFLVHGNWLSLPGTHFMQVYGDIWLPMVGLTFNVRATSIALAGAPAFLVFWAVVSGLWLTRWRWWVLAAVGAFTSVMLALQWAQIDVLAARSLALQCVFPSGRIIVAAGVAAFGVHRVLRSRGTPEANRWASIVIVACVGSVLGLRVLFRSGLIGYTIYSTPLLLLVCILAAFEIVRAVASLGRPDTRMRTALGASACYLMLFAVPAAWPYRTLGSGFIQTPRGEIRYSRTNDTLVTKVLPFILAATQSGRSVLLLPEMPALYFLAGVSSPSRYYVLTPGVLEPGKYTASFLRDLEQQQPDYVLISNRRSSEYGVDYFGVDYDQEVLEWIERRYVLDGSIGDFARRDGAPFGVAIYRRVLPGEHGPSAASGNSQVPASRIP